MRILAAAEHEVEFWVRHVRVGVRLTFATALVGLVYLAMTWQRPNRPAMLLVLVAASLCSTVVSRLRLRAIVVHPRGVWLFYAWSAATVALIAALTALDGGAVSPVSLIYTLGLMYGAMAYPPVGMFGLGGVVIGLQTLMAVAKPPVDVSAAVFNAGAYGLITGLCALTARNHWIQHDQQSALSDQLRHMAFRDGLTGLANRALFLDRVEHALARTARTGAALAVLYCDLDEFKRVNDGLGHDAGDELLIEVARRLEVSLRPGDTAARLGGDEFAILIEDVAGPDAALHLAGRVLSDLSTPLMLAGTRVDAAASIGVTVTSGAGTAADLLRDSDAAMYAAKRRGKGRVQLYDPAVHAEPQQRTLAGDLRAGLARREFYLVYQPIVELPTGAVAGVEALLRWAHPTRGLVSPAEFIPLAEQTGVIVGLGRWVLQEACTQAATWRRELRQITFTMSVNLSAHQLEDPALVDDIAGALHHAGLPASYLILELTESVLLADPEAALKTFARLKQLGVRLAIDDFGTGYSSLAYLQRLPVDIIKVDKTFIDDLGRGPAQAALTRGILQLTRSLQVTTVAEGVEKAEQLEDLRALRCELGQGFHLAHPMDAARIAEVLARPDRRVLV